MATSFSKLNVQALFSAPLLPLPLRGEWTQGHLEVIADIVNSAGFDTRSANRYTHHNEDRGTEGTVPGKDWGCR